MKGTLIVGNKRFELNGRAAIILARLADRSDWLNETPIGRAVANFAHGELKLELTESLPAIRLDA